MSCPDLRLILLRKLLSVLLLFLIFQLMYKSEGSLENSLEMLSSMVLKIALIARLQYTYTVEFKEAWIEKVYESDSFSPNLKTLLIDDVTPNESVSDVFVQELTQLMSILEINTSTTQSSVNLILQQAGLTVLDLRKQMVLKALLFLTV